MKIGRKIYRFLNRRKAFVNRSKDCRPQKTNKMKKNNKKRIIRLVHVRLCDVCECNENEPIGVEDEHKEEAEEGVGEGDLLLCD